MVSNPMHRQKGKTQISLAEVTTFVTTEAATANKTGERKRRSHNCLKCAKYNYSFTLYNPVTVKYVIISKTNHATAGPSRFY